MSAGLNDYVFHSKFFTQQNLLPRLVATCDPFEQLQTFSRYLPSRSFDKNNCFNRYFALNVLE